MQRTELGRMIQNLRESKGMNRSELAAGMGKPWKFVYKLEMEGIPSITRATQRGLAKGLGYPLARFERFVFRGKERASSDERGEYLRKLREQCGKSQAELANEVGVHQATISKLELGKRKLEISGISLPMLAIALDIDPLLVGQILGKPGSEIDPYIPRHGRCGGCEKIRDLVLGGLCNDCAVPFFEAYRRAHKQACSV